MRQPDNSCSSGKLLLNADGSVVVCGCQMTAHWATRDLSTDGNISSEKKKERKDCQVVE